MARFPRSLSGALTVTAMPLCFQPSDRFFPVCARLFDVNLRSWRYVRFTQSSDSAAGRWGLRPERKGGRVLRGRHEERFALLGLGGFVQLDGVVGLDVMFAFLGDGRGHRADDRQLLNWACQTCVQVRRTRWNLASSRVDRGRCAAAARFSLGKDYHNVIDNPTLRGMGRVSH